MVFRYNKDRLDLMNILFTLWRETSGGTSSGVSKVLVKWMDGRINLHISRTKLYQRYKDFGLDTEQEPFLRDDCNHQKVY